MIRRILFSALGAAVFAGAVAVASISVPPLIDALAISPAIGVLFLGLAALAVTAAAGVVVALGLVERQASPAISRALGLDFPAPQTGTPELTSTV